MSRLVSYPMLAHVQVTFTDGSVVPAGGEFHKVWLVRNSGSSAWPRGTRLINVGGFSNSTRRTTTTTTTVGAGARSEEVSSFEVLEAQPGETVEVGCELKAPEEAGHYM